MDEIVYFSLAVAAVRIDPIRPPSIDTMRRWHDTIHGPRDTYGRRIWTPEICEAVCQARLAARNTSTT